ncbi:hypothetical protein SUSUWATARI_00340 [Serratia phage vB_SmaM-Susuwatari]|nr:hypothetical protein SUSUWATARI_00340 [Serratia phage vB_SmaM-Susuwatari]
MTTHSEPRNKGGRPTLYTPDIPERLVDYFDLDHDEVIKHNMTTGDKSNYQIIIRKLPSMVGFCRMVGITTATLHLWMSNNSSLPPEEKARLTEHYKHARTLYENLLITVGMTTGNTFVPFMLKCNFGWRDNEEVQSNEQNRVVRFKIVSPDDRPKANPNDKPAEDWGDD